VRAAPNDGATHDGRPLKILLVRTSFQALAAQPLFIERRKSWEKG
jgi:hypothetical protein